MRVPVMRLVAAFLPALGGCTTFATVRSADVRPGPSFAVHASASTAPGDVTGWFWAYDCAEQCDDPVVGADVGVTYGWQRPNGVRAAALSAGMSGVHAYVDGYVQLAAGPRPFGVGVRVGPPVTSWREHQVYARYDVPLGASTRLLLNPGVFLHEGRSPNGENPGRFIGVVQGVGLQFEGTRVSWTPAVAVVAGQSRRDSYGVRYGPERTVFATASLGFTFHRARASDER